MNVDTAEFEAITERVAALEATVADLAERVEQATTAEAVIRRASYYPTTPRPAARRARHLRLIGGQQ